MSDETIDPRAELAALAAQVAAYVEWQLDTGALGAPRVPFVRPTTAAAAVTAIAPAPSEPFAPPPESFEPVASTQAAPTLASATTIASLPVLAETVSSCTRCPLSRSRTNTVFARGNPEATLVFVGEAPGADEDAQGLPFVGRAGQLLDKMIAAMGLSPENDVYVCNIIKCRPPANRPPTPEERDTCLPYLHQQLAAVRPKVIVALGNTSVQALLGTTLGITKLRGEWKMYRSGDTTSLVMPTYHPSYLLRPSAQQLEAKRQAWEDLQTVMKELGLKLPGKK